MSETQKHTKPNVPNLRFPGFEEEWRHSTLRSECQINPKTEQLADTFLYIDLESVVKGQLVKTNCLKKEDAPSRAQRVLSKWDILYQCVRPYQLNNYIVRDDVAIQRVASTGYAQIRTNHDPDFFFQLIHTKTFTDQVINRCTGTNYPAINSTDLSGIEINLPGKEEQRKIGRMLSLIDQRIAIQNRVIERYESLIKALAEKLMLIDCQEVKLGEISSIYQPTTISSNMLKQDGKYSVYGANGIIGFYDEYNHATPQICIACRGSSCGAVNYSLPFSWITGNAMVINTDKYANIVNKRYLYHYLTLLDYTPLISGSGQPQIVRKPLQSLKIRLPEIGTQKSIAEALDSISKKVNIEVDIRSKYMDSKRCLLSELFI